MAIKNYEHAIFLAEVCLGWKEPIEFYRRIGKEIGVGEIKVAPRLSNDERKRIIKSHAHRTYQKVMCKYKEMRYLGGIQSVLAEASAKLHPSKVADFSP